MRRLAIFGVVLAGLSQAALAESTSGGVGVDPGIGMVEVTLELPKDKPYVGEMVMLRMRSFIRAFIVLDDIQQPPLTNFDWQQLGRDKPIQAMVDGFSVAGVERDIAIFPQQSGRLVIDPFVRRVTIVTDDNRRVPMDFASKTIFIDVQNSAGADPSGAWWLPAKALSLTESWSVSPDEIAPGTLARRTITVEAVGLTADRLPPAPEMLAPGTIAFKGPAQRETIVTADGPVARATYQWDIRPVSSSPAQLPAIYIPWFDTAERRMRNAAIPAVWVAYVGTLVHASHEKPKSWSQAYLSPGPVAIGVAGFLWTAAVAFALTTRRRSESGRAERRVLREIRRAARANDERRFRAALSRLARINERRWAQIAAVPSVKRSLAVLDRARYARDGGVAPSLTQLAAAVLQGIAEVDAHEAPAAPELPNLDAPLPAR